MTTSVFYQESLACIDQAMMMRPDIIVFIGGDIPRDYARQDDLLKVGKACKAKGQDYLWVSQKEHISRAFETFNRPGARYVEVDLNNLSVSGVQIN